MVNLQLAIRGGKTSPWGDTAVRKETLEFEMDDFLNGSGPPDRWPVLIDRNDTNLSLSLVFLSEPQLYGGNQRCSPVGIAEYCEKGLRACRDHLRHQGFGISEKLNRIKF